MINACAGARDVTSAEGWFRRMKEAGIKANTITYNAVIEACAEALEAARKGYLLFMMLKAWC